jgi:hypothetical protein
MIILVLNILKLIIVKRTHVLIMELVCQLTQSLSDVYVRPALVEAHANLEIDAFLIRAKTMPVVNQLLMSTFAIVKSGFQAKIAKHIKHLKSLNVYNQAA